MKVLIIEDNSKLASLINSGLTHYKYNVTVVNDGLQGFNIAIEEQFDVIVLDLMLPNLNGLQICKKLRQRGINTPILMLTAKGTTEDIVKGLNIGANDYLTKPFEFTELYARINALSRLSYTQNKSIYKYKDVKVNTTFSKVYKNQKQVNLSKKEYLMLLYFIKNKNAVISKEQLIDNIWGYNTEISENNVEVFIKNIRKKLGKGFIKTVRGFGYKIN